MSCTYYSWKGGWFSGDFWCAKKADYDGNGRVDEDTYQKYCKNYNYDACPIYKQGEYSSGCFLTTIVCTILQKDDHDPILETMREFRNQVLQKDEKYFNILRDYDYIGPVLAYKLDQDARREQIARKLYDNSLTKIASYIKKEDYRRAVELYQGMTLYFINYYGFREEYEKNKNVEYAIREFKPETAGHGILQKKLSTKQ